MNGPNFIRASSNPPIGLVFDRQSARAVDHAAIQEFGIPGIVLMENAARALATHAAILAGSETAPHAIVVCGSGNNGGDGYAVARHLHNARFQITLVALAEPSGQTDAAINCEICRRMNLRFLSLTELDARVDAHKPALIIDAIFGTGLDRPATGDAAKAILRINSAGCPVLSADIPSGMDCDTGETLGECVKATRTVTFVGIKRGFLNPEAQQYLGEVAVGDIGAPQELLLRFGRPIENAGLQGGKLPKDSTAGPRKNPAR